MLMQMKLGLTLLDTEDTPQAINYLENAHERATQLSANRPSYQLASSDLAFVKDTLADGYVKADRIAEALKILQESLSIHTSLSRIDQADIQAQTNLSLCYQRLGDLHRNAGRFQEALSAYERQRLIGVELIKLDPKIVLSQRTQMYGAYRMGSTLHELQKYADAAIRYREAIAVLDLLIARQENVETFREYRRIIDYWLRWSEKSLLATQDLKSVLSWPVDKQAELLAVRFVEFTKRMDTDTVAQCGDLLLTLAHEKPPDAENFHKERALYNAACAFERCAKLATGWDGRKDFQSPQESILTAKQRADRDKAVRASIDALRSAIESGLDRFDQMDADEDLILVRLHPDYPSLRSEP
jgi:tetratricopeptide (TPR) repeat protein